MFTITSGVHPSSPREVFDLKSVLQSEATPGEDEMNPTVKRSGWHPPEDTGLWAIADRVLVEVGFMLSTPSHTLSAASYSLHPQRRLLILHPFAMAQW